MCHLNNTYSIYVIISSHTHKKIKLTEIYWNGFYCYLISLSFVIVTSRLNSYTNLDLTNSFHKQNILIFLNTFYFWTLFFVVYAMIHCIINFTISTWLVHQKALVLNLNDILPILISMNKYKTYNITDGIKNQTCCYTCSRD